MAENELEMFEDVLLNFERAWFECKRKNNQLPGSGSATSSWSPSVDKFASSASDATASLWVELTKIDIEHRIRNFLPIVTAEYLSGLERLESEEVRNDLLTYEFEVRKRFGRSPGAEELKSRFGERWSDWAGKLSGIPVEGQGTTLVTASGKSVDDASPDVAVLVQPGAQVNQYKINKQIGSGAFAMVYLATDMRLGRKVAIKFLRPSVSKNAGMRDRMLREAQAVASMQHPCIVPVIETGKFHDHDFIVSRFVDGENLEL